MRICCVLLIGMMSVGVSIVSVGITLGFKVNYAGSFIATVRNAAVFEDAKNIAVNNIVSQNADSAIETPSFKMTLTVSDKLDNAFFLANAIIENTNEIDKFSALYINGEKVACAETAKLENYIEEARTRFEIAGAENTSSFAENVSIESGYYLKSEITESETVKEIIDGLTVKTVSVVTSDINIPFTSKTVKTDNELIGYSKITTFGENGIRRDVDSVISINGAETSRIPVSSNIIKNPVEQVTTVGAAKTTASAAQRSEERSAGFICPMKKGSFTITSYYGDGRGHKGLDLAADRGTPIFAVYSGKVVYSGFDKNYGYTLVVDHENGLKTRYAHASTLCAVKGDAVEQGDVIALVGSSGYSTGNHLHFEVMVNDTRVNPVSYLGLD